MAATREIDTLKAQHSHVTDGWSYIPVTTFGEMFAEVTREDRTKTDHPMERGELRLDEELRLNGVPLTPHALRQFATVAKVPVGVLGLRSIGQDARLAEALNEQMEKVGSAKDRCLICPSQGQGWRIGSPGCVRQRAHLFRCRRRAGTACRHRR